MIVPGGRFREFYYWDSYWIIRGLLVSQMDQTAKGMLENFLSIVDTYGFVPNGGRIYYSQRSQPPLLTAMVKSYLDKNYCDKEFMRRALPTLEREYNFWKNNHLVDVNGHKLFVYGDKATGPRPESYREDVLLAQSLNTDQERNDLYDQIRAAAESGMDFSSRWFIAPDGTNNGTLNDLKTRWIVPVELNAILYGNLKIMSEFAKKLGNSALAAQFDSEAKQLFKVCTESNEQCNSILETNNEIST